MNIFRNIQNCINLKIWLHLSLLFVVTWIAGFWSFWFERTISNISSRSFFRARDSFSTTIIWTITPGGLFTTQQLNTDARSSKKKRKKTLAVGLFVRRILRSLQIGGWRLDAWQFRLLPPLFRLQSRIRLYIFLLFCIPHFFLLLIFWIFLLFFYDLSLISISRQENTQAMKRGKKWMTIGSERVTLLYAVRIRWIIADIKRRDLLRLSSFRFTTSDFAPSGTSISV